VEKNVEACSKFFENSREKKLDKIFVQAPERKSIKEIFSPKIFLLVKTSVSTKFVKGLSKSKPPKSLRSRKKKTTITNH